MLKAEKLGKRLTLVVLIGLIAITSFFVINSYLSSRKQLEDSVLNKLQALANTAACQIDGDAHELMIKKYSKKDELKKPLEDSLTEYNFKLLKSIKLSNRLETDIYTLFIDSLNGKKEVYLGIISGETQYYRHPYFSHPKELLQYFNIGHVLPSYEDEHGVWLSAFAPIKNSHQQVVAVVQVDQHFDTFLKSLQNILIRDILISLIIILIMASIILYLINNIVRVDKQKTQKLEQAYNVVKIQNKRISDSINYAQRIQNSIVATEHDIQKYFPQSFMYYKAKDVVSGDFPWLFEKGGNVYIGAVDCTGHGVPGAMLSFIGHFLLNEINSHEECLSPNVILDKLHNGVVKTLRQEDEETNSHDGMDIALCKINLETNKLEFSGAHRPLLVYVNEELIEIKGTKKSIGGTQYEKLNRVFENKVINLKKGDAFYFFSDGLVDQMGGNAEKEKKLGSKKIRTLLADSDHSNITNVSEKMVSTFETWMGETPQLDDVLLIGIKV